METEDKNKNFDQSQYHELEILKTVDDNSLLNNRKAASKLGVSVKLAHTTLNRMVEKGLLNIKKENSRKWHYFLTPQGIMEKARLTISFFEFSNSLVLPGVLIASLNESVSKKLSKKLLS